jgi:hypothetical protein
MRPATTRAIYDARVVAQTATGGYAEARDLGELRRCAAPDGAFLLATPGRLAALLEDREVRPCVALHPITLHHTPSHSITLLSRSQARLGPSFASLRLLLLDCADLLAEPGFRQQV